MRYTIIFCTAAVLLVFSLRAADTTNKVPHSSSFAERLREIQERDHTDAAVLPAPIPPKQPRFHKQPEHELLPERHSRTPRYPTTSDQTNQCQIVSHDAA